MQASILKGDPDQEFYTAEECYIIELSNTPEDPAVSIARARVKPGVTTRWHRLNGVSERYYILEGMGRVEIGGLAPQEVKVGDTVLIPPTCRQRITNIGSEDLVFLAICNPRFSNDIYQDIEDTQTDVALAIK